MEVKDGDRGDEVQGTTSISTRGVSDEQNRERGRGLWDIRGTSRMGSSSIGGEHRDITFEFYLQTTSLQRGSTSLGRTLFILLSSPGDVPRDAQHLSKGCKLCRQTSFIVLYIFPFPFIDLVIAIPEPRI